MHIPSGIMDLAASMKAGPQIAEDFARSLTPEEWSCFLQFALSVEAQRLCIDAWRRVPGEVRNCADLELGESPHQYEPYTDAEMMTRVINRSACAYLLYAVAYAPDFEELAEVYASGVVPPPLEWSTIVYLRQNSSCEELRPVLMEVGSDVSDS